MLTLSLQRVINFKFPLQSHQKYYITQYEELGFSYWAYSDERWLCYKFSLPHLYILHFSVGRMYVLDLGVKGLIKLSTTTSLRIQPSPVGRDGRRLYPQAKLPLLHVGEWTMARLVNALRNSTPGLSGRLLWELRGHSANSQALHFDRLE